MSDDGEYTLVDVVGNSAGVFALENAVPPGGDVEGTWSIVYKKSGDAWNALFQIEAWLTALAIDRTGILVAVDMDGTLHSDLKKKKKKALNCPEGINALWLESSGGVFAVGAQGERARVLKQEIFLSEDKQGRCLYSVHGANSDVFAVGDDGIVWSWNGSKWNEIEAPFENSLYCVHVASRSEVYVGGASSGVHCYDGDRWTRLTCSAKFSKLDVLSLVRFDGSLFAATGPGGVWKYDSRGFAKVKDWPMHALTVANDALFGVGDSLIARFHGKTWEGWDIGH